MLIYVKRVQISRPMIGRVNAAEDEFTGSLPQEPREAAIFDVKLDSAPVSSAIDLLDFVHTTGKRL